VHRIANRSRQDYLRPVEPIFTTLLTTGIVMICHYFGQNVRAAVNTRTA